MTGRPSLLAVTGVAPWPTRGGFSLRAAHLVRELAPDWEVTLVAPGVDIEAGLPGGPPLGITVRPAGLTSGWPAVPTGSADGRRLRSVVDRELARRKPDVVLLWPGTEFLALGRPGFPPAVADRVDCATLERLRAFRGSPGALVRLAQAAWYERRLVRALAATVVAGEEDAERLARLGGRRERIGVIPNGVEAAADPRFDREAPRPTVAFTGTLDYPPNVDAIRYFSHAVWPLVRRALPDARLVVAGRNPGRKVLALAAGPGVELWPNVPDMAAVLQSCWVAVAPMRLGTGVKNKVLEAWAAGRPVVMTPRAANGLRLDGATAELVTSAPEALASRVIELLRNQERRRGAGRAALELVRARHTWGGAARELSRVLQSAINPAP